MSIAGARALFLVILLAGLAGRAHAVDISFYFPIAVGGPVARVISDLAAQFGKEHPDIQVTPVYTGTYRDSIARALTAHKSGVPPACAVLFAADMYTLIDADAVVAYEDLAGDAGNRAWLDAFYPSLMGNSRVAGKTWGIPFQRSTILLYWNKRHFRDAGLDPDRAPATWDEMTQFARKLTVRNARGGVTRWGLQIPSSGFPYWLFQGLATTNGATLTNASGTATYFDQAAAVEALQYWIDLARVHKVHPPGLVEWGTTPGDFVDGRASMIWTSSGNLADLKARAGFEFGAAMLPANRRAGSPTGGGNFYIFRKSSPDQQRAALAFVQWMVAAERTARWSVLSGYIAVSPAAWETVAMKRHVAAFPQAAVARDQLAFAVAELSTHENQRVTRALNAGLLAALTGAKSAPAAMHDAQAEARRILLPYQR